jgi:hypothetical protein
MNFMKSIYKSLKYHDISLTEARIVPQLQAMWHGEWSDIKSMLLYLVTKFE